VGLFRRNSVKFGVLHGDGLFQYGIDPTSVDLAGLKKFLAYPYVQESTVGSITKADVYLRSVPKTNRVQIDEIATVVDPNLWDIGVQCVHKMHLAGVRCPARVEMDTGGANLVSLSLDLPPQILADLKASPYFRVVTEQA
jgi:hypothetical protein